MSEEPKGTAEFHKMEVNYAELWSAYLKLQARINELDKKLEKYAQKESAWATWNIKISSDIQGLEQENKRLLDKVELVDSKFVSGNSVEVERVTIHRSEWVMEVVSE